ncbi:hypothetical protein KC19_4G000200 [Ceratodon purpureus]|uniref:Uncharacterized protein n=1 Tax=Ceratodon purpureus TaxID=3225 RepID=A0A8T0I3Q6_CERPU|nr:hypothetical protein KC19_4G000200 [Ceratodon purpureus]
MLQVRYEVIEEYIPRIGGSEIGLETMYHTCTAQVNLDFDSDLDMMNKLGVGLNFQPVSHFNRP